MDCESKYVQHMFEMAEKGCHRSGRICSDDTLTALGWERDLCILERCVSAARLHLFRPEGSTSPAVVMRYEVRGWTKILVARQEQRGHIYSGML